MALSELINVLEKYRANSPGAAPETVQQDYSKVAESAPSPHLAEFYAQHPAVVNALAAGALALIMSHMSRR